MLSCYTFSGDPGKLCKAPEGSSSGHTAAGESGLHRGLTATISFILEMEGTILIEEERNPQVYQ